MGIEARFRQQGRNDRAIRNRQALAEFGGIDIAEKIGPAVAFERKRRTGDFHGQEPVLWAASELLR